MGTWAEIETAIMSAAADLDPSLLSVADATALLPVLTRSKNALAAVEAMVAARIAQTDAWRASGARSAAEDYATKTGTPIGQARDSLAAAKAISESERLRAAATAGKISPAQAGVLGDAAEDAPDAVDELLDLIERAGPGGPSLGDLKTAADQAKANADPDPEATHRRIQAERELKQWVRSSRGHLHATGTALDSAWIAAQLESLLDELRLAARDRGEVPSEAALRYDALLLLIARGAGVAAPNHETGQNARGAGGPGGDSGDAGDAPTGSRGNGPGRPPGDRPRGGSGGSGGSGGRLSRDRAEDLFSAAPDTAPIRVFDAQSDIEPDDVTLWRGGGSAGDGADAQPWRLGAAPAPHWVGTGRLAGAVLLDSTDQSQDRMDDDARASMPDCASPAVPGGPAPPRTSAGLNTHRGRTKNKKWSRAVTIIRVDATAAARGRAVDGELCEIAGTGPIPVSAVQTALAEGSRLAVVATRADGSVESVAHVRGDRAAYVDIRDLKAVTAELARTGRVVADLVHEGRRPNAHQMTALQWTSPTCSAEGCSNLSCEIDHETGYAITHTTRLGDLDPLCRRHHRLKTLAGWALVRGRGKRPFVPPDDSRHPRNAR